MNEEARMLRGSASDQTTYERIQMRQRPANEDVVFVATGKANGSVDFAEHPVHQNDEVSDSSPEGGIAIISAWGRGGSERVIADIARDGGDPGRDEGSGVSRDSVGARRDGLRADR